jgi:ubiquinone/menaquinone biosynthesis C-methylase UbiE
VAARAWLGARLRDRRVTQVVRRVLDDFLPPVVREWRPFNRFLATRFHSAAFDLDFKERAFAMSPSEIAAAYAALEAGGARYRDSDTTPAQIAAIAAAARGRVLEVGCGNGAVAAALAKAHPVIAVDVTVASAREAQQRTRAMVAVGATSSSAYELRRVTAATAVAGTSALEPREAAATIGTPAYEPRGAAVAVAGLPALPFRDRGFDTVVCAHTLEHIPDLFAAATELRRVAHRVVVVVPRQRYYRYTVDYHLHFFPSAAPLVHLFGGPSCAQATVVDGDWLLIAES